ncbi:unnamed protein product, partial [Ascophyllum nodosum]
RRGLRHRFFGFHRNGNSFQVKCCFHRLRGRRVRFQLSDGLKRNRIQGKSWRYRRRWYRLVFFWLRSGRGTPS